MLEKFARGIRQIDRLRATSVRALDEAHALFTSLQSSAFSGKL
jgi:hypothetical protein